MKKYFAILILTCLFISCNSDDNTENQNSIPVLLKTEQKSYYNSNLEEIIITNYENNRPKTDFYYTSSNVLTAKTEWGYTNNLLTSIKTYLPNGTLINESNYFYDNLNRIYKNTKTENGTIFSTTNFTYNSNNTINSSTVSNGQTSTKVFEVNNGLIVKEFVNGELIVSMVYDNLKTVSKTVNTTVYNYTYATNGTFPLTYTSLFGSNLFNAILFQNNLNTIDNFSASLITKIESQNSLKEIIYVLNANNYPINQKRYSNGILGSETIYTYQ